MANLVVALCVFLWLLEIVRTLPHERLSYHDRRDPWVEEYTRLAPREIISEPAEPQIPPEPMGLAPIPPHKP